MSFSHWLVDENRGVSSETPEKQQVSMMIDGIPVTDPNLFLPKGHYQYCYLQNSKLPVFTKPERFMNIGVIYIFIYELGVIYQKDITLILNTPIAWSQCGNFLHPPWFLRSLWKNFSAEPSDTSGVLSGAGFGPSGVAAEVDNPSDMAIGATYHGLW